MYLDALNQAKTALPQWEETLPRDHPKGLRSDKTIKLIDAMMADMAKTAEELGVKVNEPRESQGHLPTEGNS